ncbi:MAG: glycosyl transferase [Prevotella sp.]|nr:glycosyl transferase [Prevotella sp.]
MINFCTLFDSNYAAKGLAMYYSLAKHCPAFHLYVFAFDDKLVAVLEKLRLEHLTVVTLKEFENEQLLAVKPTRSAGEYCWTCASSTILYCLQHYDIASCTYIDADLFFFADPAVLLEEMGDDDVLITSHRYTPRYDQSATSGKYCVQFMTFKNTPNGLRILNWWVNACLEWCYNRYEDGKFGDQKYLDDWTERFTGVHELKHLGGGVAPWNMEQYTFRQERGAFIGTELSSGTVFPLVFFHFHNLPCYKKGIFREFNMSRDYSLPSNVRTTIYKAYLPLLKRCYREVRQLDNSIDGLATRTVHNKSYPGWIVKIAKRRLLGALQIKRYQKYSQWIEK